MAGPDFTAGDIFETGAEALVNPVNCVGVMGKGLALEFRKRFPDNYEAYRAACGRHEVRPGRMWTFDRGDAAQPRYIVNFPTKRHWRDRSRAGDVEEGLRDLRRELEEKGIGSVAIPALGAGLGGLDWGVVRDLIAKELDGMPLGTVQVFEPKGYCPASPVARLRSASVVEPRKPVFAGIGSRETPPDVLDAMRQMAADWSKQGWLLRSGGAHGADRAFQDGVPGSQRELWLPWKGYNELDGPDCSVLGRSALARCMEVAAELHPAWERCSQGARRLHARNVAILLGPNLDRPVDAVVCWTEGGEVKGGTGMGLLVAGRHGIPVFNMGKTPEMQVRSSMEAIGRAVLGSRRSFSDSPEDRAGGARVYEPSGVCAFRFTRADWGMFSNFYPMKEPIRLGPWALPTSEHVYHMFAKFPHSREVQDRIASAPTAKEAAQIGRDPANGPIEGWEDRRLDVMRWVIRLKREAEPGAVDGEFERTAGLPIVEISRRDGFWGAVPRGDRLVGENLLGRCWMELRQHVEMGHEMGSSQFWAERLGIEIPSACPEDLAAPGP